MIKKTKDAYKQIAGKVTEALEYNKTHTTQYSRINLTTLNISRGLYNSITKNGIVVAVYNVCQELGIPNANEAPFEIQLYDNGDYCQMYLRF